MKVKELIKKLQKCDKEATVIVTSDNFELNNSQVAVSFVHQYDNGREETKTFQDAFDYENSY